MKKNIYKGLITFSLVTSSLIAFAADDKLGNIKTLLGKVGSMVNSAVPIVFGLAVLAFFFGLAKYLFKGGDEGAQDDGKRLMTWGVIAMFVMASIWGLVVFLQKTLGIDKDTGNIPAPTYTYNPNNPNARPQSGR